MQNKNIYFLILEITQEIIEFRLETLLVLVKKMAGEESLANKKRLFALALFLLWKWLMFSTWFDVLYLLPAQTRRVAGGRSVRTPARHEAIPSNFLLNPSTLLRYAALCFVSRCNETADSLLARLLHVSRESTRRGATFANK